MDFIMKLKISVKDRNAFHAVFSFVNAIRLCLTVVFKLLPNVASVFALPFFYIVHLVMGRRKTEAANIFRRKLLLL